MLVRRIECRILMVSTFGIIECVSIRHRHEYYHMIYKFILVRCILYNGNYVGVHRYGLAADFKTALGEIF